MASTFRSCVSSSAIRAPAGWLAAWVLGALVTAGPAQAREQWTIEEARSWYDGQPWPVGVNYLPRTAVNQIEMWAAATFDAPTIDQELGWAERLGFNAVRVFLHDVPWREDRSGFLDRVGRFVEIAGSHHLAVAFVFFDSCWNPQPHAGRQPDPRPGVHNSAWVQSPGRDILVDAAARAGLKDYVVDVIGRFRNDRRVLLWDLYNEVDNVGGPFRAADAPDKAALSLDLAERARDWALGADPTQPVTVGIWQGWNRPAAEMPPAQRFALDKSDVVTFHAYVDQAWAAQIVMDLRAWKRPLICTEYMARTNMGNTLANLLPAFRTAGVGAFSWGFVDGRSQTKYPWDSWAKPCEHEPAVWFHDLLRADGSPFDPQEAALIGSLTRDLKRRPLP